MATVPTVGQVFKVNGEEAGEPREALVSVVCASDKTTTYKVIASNFSNVNGYYVGRSLYTSTEGFLERNQKVEGLMFAPY